MHPPEPRAPRVPKPKKPKKPKRAVSVRAQQPSPMEHWPGEWKVCHASFLAATYAKSGSDSSLWHVRSIIRDFYASIPRDRLPDQVSREEVEAYLSSPGNANGHIGEPVRYGTVNNRLAALRSWFKYAREWPSLDSEGIPQPLLKRLAPTSGIRFVQREKPPYRSLSEEQLHDFFAVIPNTIQGLKWRAFFLTAFWTAQRRGILCNLKWGDIQQAIIVEPGGKSRSAWIYAWHGGKGKSRESDSQELAPVCVEAIRAYLFASGRLDTIAPDMPIFTADPGYSGRLGYDPYRPLVPHVALRAAKKYARASQIPEELVCIHTFRHSSAMHRALAGESLLSIASVLRHSSIDMTRRYLEGLVSQADSGIALLNGKFANL
jgi:integrase